MGSCCNALAPSIVNKYRYVVAAGALDFDDVNVDLHIEKPATERYNQHPKRSIYFLGDKL